MDTPEGIADFKKRLSAIIDKAKIDDDHSILKSYGRDNSFVRGSIPDLMVSPTNREEVQEIVRLANGFKVPLIPVSSDPPRFYGDTVPAHGGVIINFKQMNRIINIDPVNRYARIEPGVTYGELIPELEKHDLKLSMPLLPRNSKSVVTSRLERQPTLIPKYQYDYIDPLLTLEVVYGTGDEFRTGSASGPGTPETLKADKVNPWGPGCVDYFRFLSGAQGTMGIVTWATVKTEVMPTIQKIYFIPVDEYNGASRMNAWPSIM